MPELDKTHVVVVQPALPAYRVALFERLSVEFAGRFVVYASSNELDGLSPSNTPQWHVPLPAIRNPLPGLEWQPGALSIHICRDDVLIVCGAPRVLSTLLLLLRARLIGTTTIWWGHYWSATTRLWRFGLRMVLLRLCHSVLFYTDEEVAHYRANFRASDHHSVSAVNNGIELDPIRHLRATYRAAERSTLLIFIGRLTPKARLDLLLNALGDPALEAVRLAVIGAGPEEHRLRKQAEAPALAGRIEWHGATVQEAQIATVANRSRLFVYPGSVGLSLIHAMAYGLPAVVHNNRWTHMPEIAAFTAGRTGYSFPEGDSAGLAKTLAKALTDWETLDSASAEALGRVETKFNTSHMTDRMVQLILSTLRARNQGKAISGRGACAPPGPPPGGGGRCG